jgi:hypothetical protein
VTAATDEVDGAQELARSRLGPVSAELELAPTLRAGSPARLHLDDGRSRDDDGPLGRASRQLIREALDAPHGGAPRPLLFAPLEPGTRGTSHDR